MICNVPCNPHPPGRISITMCSKLGHGTHNRHRFACCHLLFRKSFPSWPLQLRHGVIQSVNKKICKIRTRELAAVSRLVWICFRNVEITFCLACNLPASSLLKHIGGFIRKTFPCKPPLPTRTPSSKKGRHWHALVEKHKVAHKSCFEWNKEFSHL